MSRESEHKGTKNIEIRSLKISNFNGPRMQKEESKKRYSPEQKIMRNRNVIRTPQSSSPRPFPLQRQTKSSHEKRLSFFLEKEINQLHQSREHIEQFCELTKQKIYELKNLMQMKSSSMRVSKIQEPVYCHFTEYKLNDDLDLTNTYLLHARNTKNSPFTKSVKAKKMISKSTEIKRFPEEQFKSIEVGSESKYCKTKKMILTGGAIRSELGQNMNPELRQGSANRNSRTASRNSHLKNIRKLKQNVLPIQLENTINDCRPWQMDKTDNNFELSQIRMH